MPRILLKYMRQVYKVFYEAYAGSNKDRFQNLFKKMFSLIANKVCTNSFFSQ